MQLEKILQDINTIHHTTFQLLERYSDGEQGAFAISDSIGRRCVLKWRPGAHNLDRMQHSGAVTDLLREINYPAPQYLFIGHALEGIYTIQTTLSGSPMRSLTKALLSRLLNLNTLQENCALSSLPDWHQEAVTTVLSGGEEYCLHTTLQHHSQETGDLLEKLQTLASLHQHEPHRTGDIVHNDFQHSNILVQDEHISGIIDWDAPYAGDSIFDITTLLFYAHDQADMRELLWHHALERGSINLLSLYLSHLILRQVDWSLRYHDLATSRRYIDRGWALLREIAHRQ